MSEEEERELKKSVLFEYDETRKQLDLRRVEARRLGDGLLKIGDKLAYRPERVVFNGEPAPANSLGEELLDASLLNADKVREVVSAIRVLEERLANLAEQKKTLGLE